MLAWVYSAISLVQVCIDPGWKIETGKGYRHVPLLFILALFPALHHHPIPPPPSLPPSPCANLMALSGVLNPLVGRPSCLLWQTG